MLPRLWLYYKKKSCNFVGYFEAFQINGVTFMHDPVYVPVRNTMSECHDVTSSKSDAAAVPMHTSLTEDSIYLFDVFGVRDFRQVYLI